MCEALSLPASSPQPCASLLSQLWSLLVAVSPGNHDGSQTTEAGAQTLWLEKSLLTGIVHAGHPSDLETKRNNIYIYIFFFFFKEMKEQSTFQAAVWD